MLYKHIDPPQPTTEYEKTFLIFFSYCLSDARIYSVRLIDLRMAVNSVREDS